MEAYALCKLTIIMANTRLFGLEFNFNPLNIIHVHLFEFIGCLPGNSILINMNFIFFSIQFPDTNVPFCQRLSEAGANVLGIGDAGYDALDQELKSSMTEYYRVNDLGNYDEVLRSVGYFTHKYGKIDRFESLNEHWLELEASIRGDFNIPGIRPDYIENIKRKSRMKQFFKKSGVDIIPYIKNANLQKATKFALEQGFPIIIKPDKGSGASMTYRISSEEELKHFFETAPGDMDFIAEDYIEGDMYTYDGLVDREGNILFDSCTLYGQSVMDVVNTGSHMHYISLPSVPDEIKEIGSKVVEAFGVGEKFFHLEIFRSEDGRLIPLEMNMRPPGAWMTDAINFSHDTDIYRAWANLVVHGKADVPGNGKYFTAFANRRDARNYLFSHDDILERLNGKVVKYAPIAPIFSKGMGNHGYQFRAETREDVEEMLALIQKEK
jgi:hypothetical protein